MKRAWLFLLVIIFLLACQNEEAAVDVTTALEELHQHNTQLSNENAQLEVRLAEVQADLDALQSRYDALDLSYSQTLQPFYDEITPQTMLLKDLFNSFPFGIIQCTGYYHELELLDYDGNSISCPSFVLLDLEQDLYQFFEEKMDGGNSFNHRVDGRVALSLDFDGIPEDLLHALLASTRDEPISIQAFLTQGTGGGSPSCGDYMIPLRLE